jgi:hypothetical protein
VLPPVTWLVGCQASKSDRPGEDLSAPVRAAIDVAAAEVRRLVADAGVPWN